MTGTIKTLTDRGFGFIAREGEEKDLFFHAKDLQGVAFDDLRVGDTMTFEVSESDKGPSAVNVSRAGEAGAGMAPATDAPAAA
jgi:CspA family cold shock protein